jgi:heme/copper-type cytochrome/quinol oxidase subunit 2
MLRDAMRIGASGLLLLLIMVVGSLVLWVGVPAGWLWIGSQIQGETGDIGAAILVMMVGVLVSVLAIVMVLVRLNRVHEHMREARGLPVEDYSVLERVLVVTAGIALVAFTVWFLGFAGPGPSIAPR